MGEFFMGQMLDQPELPANSPRPPETPSDGIIVTDIDGDGYTRRYLYKAMNGESEQVLISEVATGKVSGVAVAVEEVPSMVEVNEPYLAQEVEPEPVLGTVDPYLAESEVEPKPSSRPLKIPPLGATIVKPGVMPQVTTVRPTPSAAMGGGEPLRTAAPAAGSEAPLRTAAPALSGAPPLRTAVPTVEAPSGARPMPQISGVRANAGPVLSGATHLRAAASPVESPVAHQRPIPAHAAPPPAAPISAAPLPMRDQMAPVSGVVSPSVELGRSVQVQGASPDQAQFSGAPASFQVSHPDIGRTAPIQTQAGPLSNQKSILQSAQRPVGGPTSLMSQELRLRTTMSPMLGQAATPPPAPIEQSAQRPVGGPTSLMSQELRLRSAMSPMLGQAATAPIEQPASGVEQPPVSGKCPGAVEMPDGRVVEPEDFISLNDFCELFPFLMQTYGGEAAAKAGLTPGQKVPVVGQSPGANGAVPSTSQFGPAGNGPYGRTGGGFVGGGGGGPGPAGARGFQGPTGVDGSAAIDFISKTDGDFTAGPGAFIAVPGTLLAFSTTQAGLAVFLLQSVLGTTTGAAGTSESGQIGLRINGVDYVVATRLLHTMAAGVSEYQIAQPGSVTVSLPAGSHTVEVVTRGLGVGEFGGTGLGTPLTVVANPSVPLNVTVLHR